MNKNQQQQKSYARALFEENQWFVQQHLLFSFLKNDSFQTYWNLYHRTHTWTMHGGTDINPPLLLKGLRESSVAYCMNTFYCLNSIQNCDLVAFFSSSASSFSSFPPFRSRMCDSYSWYDATPVSVHNRNSAVFQLQCSIKYHTVIQRVTGLVDEWWSMACVSLCTCSAKPPTPTMRFKHVKTKDSHHAQNKFKNKSCRWTEHNML